jgi:hypothetical protein
MSRLPGRLDEERHKYFLSFEKDFGNDLNKAKQALEETLSENEGQILRKTYLKEWIAAQEFPIEQKVLQERQIGIAEEANKIARGSNKISAAAFLVSIVAIIISLYK